MDKYLSSYLSLSSLKILLLGFLLSLGVGLYLEFANAQDKEEIAKGPIQGLAATGIPSWLEKIQKKVDEYPKLKEMLLKFSSDQELIEEITKIPTSKGLSEMRIWALIIVLVGFFIMLVGNGDLGIFGKFLKKLLVFYFIFFSEFILFIIYFPKISQKIIFEVIGLLI